ncbi:acetolactate decarboxylase [Lacticaseibacillus mingshuiensis]|uniref:acetolactate decarboxylase n=1 Tax=Lacticaseibacillus mingshuiensis TaxID=2799574 RepID=UPI0019526DA4|nr:acetolactate decarboxylase [Lacticaseibacillus mingshuiensis]
MTEKEDQLLYQHGTLGALVPGLFAGTQTLTELLQHGDTGIGTLDGLDGELIILAGQVYQVAASGQVHLIADTDAAKVPFANVHHAAFETVGQVVADTQDAFANVVLKLLGTRNLFAAVRLHGTFGQVTTRAVAKQVPPYPTLTETAADQAVFTRKNVTGTLLGYYSPQLYAGMATPSFHLHFLSDAHDLGGHVLVLGQIAGALETQLFSDLQLHLPTENSAFLQEDLDGDLLGEIAQAEH